MALATSPKGGQNSTATTPTTIIVRVGDALSCTLEQALRNNVPPTVLAPQLSDQGFSDTEIRALLSGKKTAPRTNVSPGLMRSDAQADKGAQSANTASAKPKIGKDTIERISPKEKEGIQSKVNVILNNWQGKLGCGRFEIYLGMTLGVVVLMVGVGVAAVIGTSDGANVIAKATGASAQKKLKKPKAITKTEIPTVDKQEVVVKNEVIEVNTVPSDTIIDPVSVSEPTPTPTPTAGPAEGVENKKPSKAVEFKNGTGTVNAQAFLDNPEKAREELVQMIKVGTQASEQRKN